MSKESEVPSVNPVAPTLLASRHYSRRGGNQLDGVWASKDVGRQALSQIKGHEGSETEIRFSTHTIDSINSI